MNEVVVDVKIDATWIWDAQLCRMDWANQEGLAFIGLESLSGLQKIRYNSTLPWVQQINSLSAMTLPETGCMEKISFPDGSVLNCWVKNHRTENGHQGLWIILKGDQQAEEDGTVAPKKTDQSFALADETGDRLVVADHTSVNPKASNGLADTSVSERSKNRSAAEQEKSESGKILALIARQINAKTSDVFKKVRLPRTAISPEGVLTAQDNVTVPSQEEVSQSEGGAYDPKDRQKPGAGLPGMAELVEQMKRVGSVNDNEVDAVSPPVALQGDGLGDGKGQISAQTASNSEGIQDAVLVSGVGDSRPSETKDLAKEAGLQKPKSEEAVAVQHLPDNAGLPVASAIVDDRGGFSASSELFALALGYHNEDDFLKNADLEKVLPQVYEKLVAQNGGTVDSQLFEKSEAMTKSGRKVSLSLSAKTGQAEGGTTHYLILYPEGIPQSIEMPKAVDGAKPAKVQGAGSAAGVANAVKKSAKGEQSKPGKSLKGKTQKAVKKPRPKVGKQGQRKQSPKRPVVPKTVAPKEQLVKGHSGTEAHSSISDDYERTLPFLAKVSHEIRTPLNSIIGFSEIMKEEQFGPISNERYLGYLDDIFVSANHALSLVNDMLDISRIQAGSMEVEREGLDLNEEVHSAIKSMAPQFANKEIHVWQGLSEESLPILCDKRSLRQIVLNLVSNAVKYTPKGGQITVSTALEEGSKVVLRVRDTGIGMSESDIRQAMKPFQRLDTILRHETNGSGLGLPLTKALIEANKAEFRIESAVDKGTVVSVTFPKT